MNQNEYIQALTGILLAHAGTAGQTIRSLVAALPPKAHAIHFAIHPDQDGCGTFSVVASLDGPDLYVLNKAIDAHRYLFDVRYTSTGVEPAVPLLDPENTEFDVQNAIVDTAMHWVRDLWQNWASQHSPLPAVVYGEEGYGTLQPILLPSATGTLAY